MPNLDASYALCQKIARATAGNFYYAFLPLARHKRAAMCALYAFMRHTDDLGDSDEPLDARCQSLAAWRDELNRAFDGYSSVPILPALVDTVEQFRIPRQYLFDVLDGVQMDLDGRSYETFSELTEYCYRVASVVGLACIHVWGFRDPAALEPARRCGVAFQLTNILRDLKEDADRGRIYLPRSDLRQFQYSEADLAARVCDDRFRELMRFQIDRAESFYAAGPELEPFLAADGQAAFGVMFDIYHGLLERIRQVDGDVFRHRVRLSTGHKIWLAARGMVRRRFPAVASWV